MNGPMNVKFPNNTRKWQMEFNSAFKGLMFLVPCISRVSYRDAAEVVRDVTLCQQASTVTDTSLHPTRLYLQPTNNDKNINVRCPHVLLHDGI
jgi:hypothetical protein